MTFLQAEQFIEDKATELKLTKDGKLLSGYWSRLVVAKKFDSESEDLWKKLETNSITIEAYVAGWEKLIQEMHEFLYIMRLEKKLSGL